MLGAPAISEPGAHLHTGRRGAEIPSRRARLPVLNKDVWRAPTRMPCSESEGDDERGGFDYFLRNRGTWDTRTSLEQANP